MNTHVVRSVFKLSNCPSIHNSWTHHNLCPIMQSTMVRPTYMLLPNSEMGSSAPWSMVTEEELHLLAWHNHPNYILIAFFHISRCLDNLVLKIIKVFCAADLLKLLKSGLSVQVQQCSRFDTMFIIYKTEIHWKTTFTPWNRVKQSVKFYQLSDFHVYSFKSHKHWRKKQLQDKEPNVSVTAKDNNADKKHQHIHQSK